MNNAEKRKALSDKITANNIKMDKYQKKMDRLRLENIRYQKEIDTLR